MPISQNTALFSLVGTTYGGDGRTTLGLPDLQGRAAMHPGRGPGLTARRLGEKGGERSVTLGANHLPRHAHSVHASGAAADTGNPVNSVPATSDSLRRYGPADDLEDLAADAVGSTGGAAHPNEQPYLVVSYIIALVGLFPSRS